MAEVEPLLHALRLWSRRHDSPFSLSQGEKRRLSVGTAVLTRPQVLLLDEPTYGQDRETALWLGTYLQERAAEGHAIAVATHDMEWVDRFCTDALVLEHGQTLFNGAVDDLWHRSRILERASLVAPARIRLAERLTHAG
jgi:energy-coupling factor transport system ATP-binding protein